MSAIFVPPVEILYRVVSREQSADEFVQHGQSAASDVLAGLDRHSAKPQRVLDFGCGCARVMQPVHATLRDAEFTGVDID